MLHVEVIENVLGGAGDCPQTEVETKHSIGFLRGFQSYFYGRWTTTKW